jgi:hypothetical protein
MLNLPSRVAGESFVALNPELQDVSFIDTTKERINLDNEVIGVSACSGLCETDGIARLRSEASFRFSRWGHNGHGKSTVDLREHCRTLRNDFGDGHGAEHHA